LGDEAGFPDDAGFPLPGASGDMPLGEEEPEFADADAVSDADFPLPGGDALGDSGFPLPGVAPAAPSAFPLPGGPAPGASAPLGGGGFNIPLPGSGDGWPPAGGANEPDPFASSPASSPFPGAGMSMDDEVVPMPSPSAGPSRGSRGDGPPGGRVVRNEDSVVAPFHGGTGIGPKAGQPLDNSVLDFIDSEAGEARTKKRVWRIRKRNGKVLGPHDEATLLKMIQSQDLQGNEEASEDGAFWKPMSQVPALADEIQRMMLNALDGPGGLPGGDVPQEPDTGQEVVEEVAPVKGKKGQKPPKEDQGGERTRVPWKLLVAAVLVFGLVGGAAYTHFFMPDAGVLGWKWVMAKVKPPEEKKPDPADLVKKPIPVWQDTTVETLILEDNLASYEEAARKLEAQLATGKLGAAIPLARSLVLAAVMDGQAAKADEALLALQRVEGADPRAVAAVKALALLAKGDADGALKTALEAAGAGAPELKDQPAQVRTALSDLESAAAFALLRKGKTEEALTRFDWALMASPQSVVATVGQARALQVAGDSQTALAYLERAVAIQPDNLRARVLAGELLLKAKNSKQAKVHLLVVAGPTGAKGTPAQRAAAKRMLSDVALEEKDIKAATDYMAAASAETPQDLDLKVRAGQLNLRLRQFPQALAVFDDVLKVKPDDESAIVGSAAAKLGATDALGAYKQVMDAAAKFPQSPQLKYWLGVAAEAMTKTQEAEASFKQSMVLDPKRAAPVVALAQFSIKDRKYQEAITRLQEARARVAPEEEHWLRATLAQVYVKQRNFALAFKEFEAALTAAPDNAEARARYGAALREAGRFDQAKKHLQDALSDDPRNAMILAEMGTYFQTQGMYDKAIDFYQQAIAIAPKDDDYFVRMGSATYAKGDASGAVEFLKTAQSLNPTNPDVSYWMGLVLRKSEPEKAKGLFKQGMDLAPEDDRFDHEMGRTFANEGVFIEAIDHLRNAIRKNPNNGDAHFDLGKALQEQARHVDAREHYNRAVDLMPQKAFIRLWLADTFNKTGEYAEAARQYRVAIEKDSTLTDAYCKLADVYRNDTKFRQAAGMYEKCLEQQPNHKEAWKWMGYTYEAMGGKFSKKALDAWQKHVKANPEDGDNDVLREKIADLR
jgi:tetratricopeptide (TPR) repeat protein